MFFKDRPEPVPIFSQTLNGHVDSGTRGLEPSRHWVRARYAAASTLVPVDRPAAVANKKARHPSDTWPFEPSKAKSRHQQRNASRLRPFAR